MLDHVATGGPRETDTDPEEVDLVEVALDVLLAKAVELEGGTNPSSGRICPTTPVAHRLRFETTRCTRCRIPCAFWPETTLGSWVLSGMFPQPVRPSVMTWAPGSTIRPTKPCSVLDDLSKIRSR